MNPRSIIPAVFSLGCILILGCASNIKTSSVRTLEAPNTDQGYLVIGSIIVQNNFLLPRYAVRREGIEVAVLGRTEENGKSKMTGYWTKTDTNGYFFVPDVPPGQYTLKGIRVKCRDTIYVITNPLRPPGSIGFQLQRGESIIFDGEYFVHKPRGRIVNLQHNYFTIDYGVGYATEEEVTELELISGDRIDLPRVQEYFIQKYPRSEWVPLLEESLISK